MPKYSRADALLALLTPARKVWLRKPLWSNAVKLIDLRCQLQGRQQVVRCKARPNIAHRARGIRDQHIALETLYLFMTLEDYQ
jgi:hypothetical protein